MGEGVTEGVQRDESGLEGSRCGGDRAEETSESTTILRPRLPAFISIRGIIAMQITSSPMRITKSKRARDFLLQFNAFTKSQ